MEFRLGSPMDAEAIADLIASFQSELTDDPSGAGAEEFLDSVSLQAEREYLGSERYRYLLAYSDSQLTGFIAIRDGCHLFHLFVERSHQRQGIARQLWERALRELCSAGSDGSYTVNSSLSAVPVYQAFGFVPAGSVQSKHGISFLPMRRPAFLVKA
ncbi:MAG: GNAT family N-acetyltransferase [Nitrospirota bacterium]|jgi:GNAT superfamily N-acetyltransferase